MVRGVYHNEGSIPEAVFAKISDMYVFFDITIYAGPVHTLPGQ